MEDAIKETVERLSYPGLSKADICRELIRLFEEVIEIVDNCYKEYYYEDRNT